MVMGLELPVFIGRVLLVCAVLVATAYPLMYMGLPWHHSLLGRVVMAQAITIAAAIDLKFVLTFFLDPRTRTILLWVNVGILTGVVITSGMLCYILASIRLENRRKRRR